MYDPKVGRWLEVDPIGFAGGDANLYRYVENDPTNATDPSGLAGRYICIHQAEPPLPTYWNWFKGDAGFRLNTWEFTKVSFKWKGGSYKGDVSVELWAQRRFSVPEFGDDTKLENFATFITLKYEFTNLSRIEGDKANKVDDMKDEYVLTMLPGVFIVPTVENFAMKFEPTSYDAFVKELLAGLEKLPRGHDGK
jgi:hypothetical protein